MYCTKCGAENDEAAVFCIECGEKLKQKTEDAEKEEKKKSYIKPIAISAGAAAALIIMIILAVVGKHKVLGQQPIWRTESTDSISSKANSIEEDQYLTVKENQEGEKQQEEQRQTNTRPKLEKYLQEELLVKTSFADLQTLSFFTYLDGQDASDRGLSDPSKQGIVSVFYSDLDGDGGEEMLILSYGNSAIGGTLANSLKLEVYHLYNGKVVPVTETGGIALASTFYGEIVSRLNVYLKEVSGKKYLIVLSKSDELAVTKGQYQIYEMNVEGISCKEKLYLEMKFGNVGNSICVSDQENKIIYEKAKVKDTAECVKELAEHLGYYKISAELIDDFTFRVKDSNTWAVFQIQKYDSNIINLMGNAAVMENTQDDNVKHVVFGMTEDYTEVRKNQQVSDKSVNTVVNNQLQSGTMGITDNEKVIIMQRESWTKVANLYSQKLGEATLQKWMDSSGSYQMAISGNHLFNVVETEKDPWSELHISAAEGQSGIAILQNVGRIFVYGDTMYFSRSAETGYEICTCPLSAVTASVDEEKIQVITNINNRELQLAFLFADDEHIYYGLTDPYEVGTKGSVMSVNKDGSELKVILADVDVMQTQILTGGDTFYLLTECEEKSELYSMDRDGKNYRKVAAIPVNKVSSIAIAEGKMYVLADALYEMNLDGSGWKNTGAFSDGDIISVPEFNGRDSMIVAKDWLYIQYKGVFIRWNMKTMQMEEVLNPFTK